MKHSTLHSQTFHAHEKQGQSDRGARCAVQTSYRTVRGAGDTLLARTALVQCRSRLLALITHKQCALLCWALFTAAPILKFFKILYHIDFLDVCIEY